MESQQDRLARAAAALAAAEGVVAGPRGGPAERAGAGAGVRASAGAVRGEGKGEGKGEGPRVARGPSARPERTRPAEPPPEDPQAKASEADPYSVARAIVLRQLALAPRSRAQLERKLRDRGCADDVAEQVLDRMTEVGLVDDEAYAEMLVRSKQSTKGLARRALAHELRKQGIDGDLADEALAQVGQADERDKAEQLVARKMRTMHGLAADVQARRLAGMLARKGYSGEVAWPIIRDAIDRAAEHQRD